MAVAHLKFAEKAPKRRPLKDIFVSIEHTLQKVALEVNILFVLLIEHIPPSGSTQQFNLHGSVIHEFLLSLKC